MLGCVFWARIDMRDNGSKYTAEESPCYDADLADKNSSLPKKSNQQGNKTENDALSRQK